MRERLRSNGLHVSRNVVRMAMKFIDNTAVERRKRRRLHRRKYENPGPNHCWHVDGYDKLKPYGFAIHGAIDGFSRRVLWLKVATTNNHPQVIALYFIRCVLELNKLPRILRCDRGTENVHLEKIQKVLRRHGSDPFAGLKSFMYGRSTANQRIEAWWSMLRRQCTNFWINKFKDFQSLGLLDTSDPVHINCLRLCFMEVLQKHLDRIMEEWNVHIIQARKNNGNICDRPDKMYFIPEAFDTISYAAPFNEDEALRIEIELENDEGVPAGLNPDFIKVIDAISPDWDFPDNFERATAQYVELVSKLSTY